MAYTTIDDPEAYFQVKIYTGDGTAIGSGGLALTLDGDTDMQPDLIWIKCRSNNDAHAGYDAVRGTNKRIGINEPDAESSQTEGLATFGSDGFTVGSLNASNGSSRTYVAWCWKESAVSGMDIVAYTGNGTDDTDISHNLSAVPKMIIVKNRDAADAWQVYHGANTAAPETDYLVLNTNAVTVDAADRWSDEAPTSSVFTLGDADEVNTNTEDYIAYLFAEKQGFSKFGTYVGTNNADGTFVYTGFRPAFIMTKSTSTGADDAYSWAMFDNKRSSYNIERAMLKANIANVEVDNNSNADVDFLSNGFKPKASPNETNGANTYIYMAFAEAPFVNSNGVPCNAR